MTRDHHQPPHLVTRIGRGSALIAVAFVAFVGLSTMSADDADAARRTKSAVIAGAASEAADALERWQLTSNPVDYVRFVQQRDRTATMTEADVELSAGALRDAWSQVPLAKQEAVLNAMSQLGVPYRSLASEPGVGFDCSGLTIWAFGEAEIELPRVSSDQINDSVSVDRADAVAGDLAYYPGHISIYLGADLVIHSPNSGSHVEVTWLPERSLRFGDVATAMSGTADADVTDSPAGRITGG